MAATPATRVPRSALTFSSAGDLGVRTVDTAQKVLFVPVSVLQDDQQFMWVAGLADNSRLIVQGQDFVRDAQVVETVKASNVEASAQ
jgi:multidrug efflux system membrane fusion protein